MNKDNILKLAAVALFGGLFWVFSQNRMRKIYSQSTGGNGGDGGLPEDGEPGIGEGNECGVGPFTEPLDLQPYEGGNFANPYLHLSNYSLADSSQQGPGTDAIEQWYVGTRLKVINPCDGSVKYDLDLESFMNGYFAGTAGYSTTDVSYQNIGITGVGTPQFQVTKFKIQLQQSIARGLYDVVFEQGPNRAPITTAYGIQSSGLYEGLELDTYYCGVVPENTDMTQANKQF